MKIVQISESELSSAFPVIHQLRPHLTESTFRERVRRQEQQGFRITGVQDAENINGLAGWRILENLACGKFLYVDDLITDSNSRSRGAGKFLLDWLKDEALRHGCDELHLDSGVQRFSAHRFYLRERMEIICHHFDLKLK